MCIHALLLVDVIYPLSLALPFDDATFDPLFSPSLAPVSCIISHQGPAIRKNKVIYNIDFKHLKLMKCCASSWLTAAATIYIFLY